MNNPIPFINKLHLLYKYRGLFKVLYIVNEFTEVMTLTLEMYNHWKNQNIGLIFDRLSTFTRDDVSHFVDRYIGPGIIEGTVGNSLYVSSLGVLANMLSNQGLSNQDILLRSAYSPRTIEIADRLIYINPVLAIDDQILSSLENICYGSRDGRFTLSQQEEMFDFSSFSDVSSGEIGDYLSIINHNPNYDFIKSLRNIKFKAEKLKESVSKSIDALVNEAIGRDYFRFEDFRGMAASEIAQDNSISQFYNNLIKRFGDDKDNIFSNTFIESNLLPLYLMNKTGLLTLDGLPQTTSEIGLSGYSDEVLYDHLFDLWYIHSFGTSLDPYIASSTYTMLPQDLGLFGRSLQALAQIKKDRGAFYSKLDYILKVSQIPVVSGESIIEQGTRRNVFLQFAQGLSRSNELEYLLTNSPNETIASVHKLFQLEGGSQTEKLLMNERFLNATKGFYDLLSGSCTPETILEEYKNLLHGIEGIASLDDFQNYFRLNSPGIREIFLKYNSPATFEEQEEVARIIAKSVSGRDLQVTKANFSNLLQEIPLGYGLNVNLPSEINLFQAKRDNAWFYNVLACLYGGMHRYDTFDLGLDEVRSLAKRINNEKSIESLSDYFSLFPNYRLAELIFANSEQIRLFSHLTEDYSGLKTHVRDYFQARKDKRDNIRFEHISQQIFFDVYNNLMLEERNDESSTERKSITSIQDLLNSVRLSDKVSDSLKLIEPIYKLIESTCKDLGDPIPEKKDGAIDKKILENLLKSASGKDILVYEVSRESAGFRYAEFNPEEQAMSTVFEDVVPSRKNPSVERILSAKQSELEEVRRQLEILAPRDVYVQRKQINGTLDRRAYRRYKEDIESGKVPNPRIFYKKVIEHRDVASIFAINMNRQLNKQIDGYTPRAAIQELMALFLEGSRSLDDRVGIYGFSGTGRDNVVISVFKDIKEPFTEEVYYRLGFFGGQNYNRNGAAYRHFTGKLNDVPERNKFFIELGASYVPFDVGYRGETAIKDSSQAIAAMKLNGIQPFCISFAIDKESKENLENVFGKGNYAISTPASVYRDLTKLYSQMTR